MVSMGYYSRAVVFMFVVDKYDFQQSDTFAGENMKTFYCQVYLFVKSFSQRTATGKIKMLMWVSFEFGKV